MITVLHAPPMNYLHDRHKRNTHNLKVQHSVPKNGNPLEQQNSRKYCKNKTYPFEESKDTSHCGSKSVRQPQGENGHLLDF